MKAARERPDSTFGTGHRETGRACPEPKALEQKIFHVENGVLVGRDMGRVGRVTYSARDGQPERHKHAYLLPIWSLWSRPGTQCNASCTTQTSKVSSSPALLHQRHLKTRPQCDRCARFGRPFPASRPARGLSVGPAQNNDRAHFQRPAKPTGLALTRP